MSLRQKLRWALFGGVVAGTSAATFGLGNIHGEGTVVQEYRKSELEEAKDLSQAFQCDNSAGTNRSAGCAKLKAKETLLQMSYR